ncbi:MAG: hypothetical protein ACTHOB_08610 [Ginsengibacter sp.]
MKTYIEFDGYCPESKLKGKHVEMRLNENDFWESEETGLQIVISEPYAAILQWRGNNKLRDSSPNASDLHYGLLLTESLNEEGKEIFQNEQEVFTSRSDLEVYLKEIV